jgi:NTE family protein
VVVRPRLQGVGSADFAARARAIAAGREAAQQVLPELRNRITALTRSAGHKRKRPEQVGP